jgi:hypothetical protein
LYGASDFNDKLYLGSGGGSGSGGTIVIDVGELNNSGSIRASGGLTGQAGGHGRMAFMFVTCFGSYCPETGYGSSTTIYTPNFPDSSYCTQSGGKYICTGFSN